MVNSCFQQIRPVRQWKNLMYNAIESAARTCLYKTEMKKISEPSGVQYKKPNVLPQEWQTTSRKRK